jgi:DNA-binding LacI/PurR family transcriptional regulator
MTIRLKDIAQEANVSISTVSRILSNDSSRKSNDKTIARVFEAAEKLGYFAQKFADARYLGYKTGERVYSVACILTSEHETYVSPFFNALMAGIQQEVITQGARFPHNFFVTHINDNSFMNFIENTHLDCAIMLGRTTLSNIQMIKNSISNLVYAGVNEIGADIDEVVCDARSAVKSGVEYLIKLGHTKIGFLGPTKIKHQVFNEHRFTGYKDAMELYNLLRSRCALHLLGSQRALFFCLSLLDSS